ncbi:MAG: glycosyltransferase family 2 protein [Phycisphaerae bacterium]|nr:glycosyltransferase family 2 protein [Phycisphaerae bacterium]
MIFYYVFTAIILMVQALVLVEAWRNFLFVRRKYRPKISTYLPSVALISPCKGLDTTFDRNINALFDLDYPDYRLHFVVESDQDLAFKRLNEIISERKEQGCKVEASLTIAGIAQLSSQKVHNLLAVCDNIPKDREVLAFVDSDACPRPHFLRSLVHPLRNDTAGASTGYRWYIPADKRLSSQVLSSMNAFFAAQLGPHNWNSAWGGAMAIRREMFHKLEIAKLWRHALSDDYTLTWAVKKAELEIVFVPSCFVASYEKSSWSEMFSFARRQFIITRVCMPKLWRLAVLGFGHFIAAFWLGFIVSLYQWHTTKVYPIYPAILPTTLLALAIFKAVLRQGMIRKILPDDKSALIIPALIDIFAQPILAIYTFIAILSAGFTRTISWRNTRYIIHAVDKTEILH